MITIHRDTPATQADTCVAGVSLLTNLLDSHYPSKEEVPRSLAMSIPETRVQAKRRCCNVQESRPSRARCLVVDAHQSSRVCAVPALYDRAWDDVSSSI